MKQLWFPEIDFVQPVLFKGLPALASNNAYILGRGPVTLIDTGICGAEGLEPLRVALAERGLGFAAVERIILTHGHIDHYGQAAAIMRAAGHAIETWIHPLDAARVREAWSEAHWLKLAAWLEAMGVPPEQLGRIQAHFGLINQLAEPVADLSLLSDGQVFAGPGWRLEAIHTPGHSSGSVCLLDSAAGLLFCGDLILKGLFPSPFVEKDRPGCSGYRPYLASLARLENLPVRTILPGHGAACEDLPAIITRYRQHQVHELERVRQLIPDAPCSVYELAQLAYPQSVKRDVFLSLVKTAVYLEALAGELVIADNTYARR